jgi:hypothetical protein
MTPRHFTQTCRSCFVNSGVPAINSAGGQASKQVGLEAPAQLAGCRKHMCLYRLWLQEAQGAQTSPEAATNPICPPCSCRVVFVKEVCWLHLLALYLAAWLPTCASMLPFSP